MRGEERDPCLLLTGVRKPANGGTKVTCFEDPDGPQPPPAYDEKDLQSVLALFRLAYVLAADDADDSTPRRDQGNERTDQRRRAVNNQSNNQGLSSVIIGLGVLLIVLGESL